MTSSLKFFALLLVWIIGIGLVFLTFCGIWSAGTWVVNNPGGTLLIVTGFSSVALIMSWIGLKREKRKKRLP